MSYLQPRKQGRIQDFPEGVLMYYLAIVCQKLHEN